MGRVAAMNMLATPLLAANVDSVTPLQLIGLLALGLAGLVGGVLQWTGRILRSARYQTLEGSGAIGIPAGLGIIFIVIGAGAHNALDKPDDWWFWWVMSIIGASLCGLGTIYLFAYFWTGVPKALRPRPQRGQPKMESLRKALRNRK